MENTRLLQIGVRVLMSLLTYNWNDNIKKSIFECYMFEKTYQLRHINTAIGRAVTRLSFVRNSKVQISGRSSRTQCCQRFVTDAILLRKKLCYQQAQWRGDGPRPGPLRGGSRGCLRYRARIFWGARNFKKATRKTIDIGYKFERATLDCLKADRVTQYHHLPVQFYPSHLGYYYPPPPPASITAEVGFWIYCVNAGKDAKKPEVGAKMPSQITYNNAVYPKFCAISNKQKKAHLHTETAKSFLFFIGIL